MPTPDRPLYRNGRVVLKVRPQPDGSIVLFKPFLITPDRVMRLTDAPGWDKEHVDAVFTDGIAGSLRYTQDIVQYDISIKDFREHAFVREDDGAQYHVHRKYYKSTGLRTVDPRRESKPEAESLPAKLTFGEWVPCTRCKTSGRDPDRKERCSKCQGRGFIPISSSATS